ncbi:acyltransferase family protein [Agrococcus sp. TSP3-2-1]|uniref:acyltransferase family protein n=1 Tax=Agrococcus sp. TSP3-2-1 TaxID=2804583 RepID=UPI003CF19953
MTAHSSPRRHDLQGLRALASLLVATSHIWFGNVSGGVDVFFAIGGFLLASSLIGEIERSGRMGVIAALWRQGKRLFPMAGIVLVVAGSIALVASGPLLLNRVAHDISAAATYRMNERLASTATDYLGAGLAKSEFQHFWAMSVQGQWTALCIVLVGMLAFALGDGAARRARTIAGALLGVAAVASFVYANHQIAIDPVPAYYDTLARSWELALGGFAALVLTRIPLSAVARAVMGVVGIALVLTAGMLPQHLAQPGAVTLWPVTGALLVLLAGHGAESGLVGRALSWRPLVWLGGISYGLYLWHWPVLKGLVALDPAQGDGVGLVPGALVLALSIALAWGSTRLIALASRPRQRESRSVPRLVPLLPAVATAAAVAIAIAPGIQERAIATQAAAAPQPESPEQLQEWVAQSVSTPTAPMRGAVSGEAGQSSEWLVDECSTVEEPELDACRYPAPPATHGREAWLVGDSQAVALAPGVRAALAGHADVQLLGRELCPFSSAPVVARELGEDAAACDEHIALVLGLAAERKPDLVVITYGAWWVGDGYRHLGADVGRRLAEGTIDLMRQLDAIGVRSVWLDSAPPFAEMQACIDAVATDGDLATCIAPLDDEELRRHERMVETISAGGGDLVDTLGWYCDVERRACPLIAGGVYTWADPHHISAPGAMQRVALLEDALLPRLRAEQADRDAPVAEASAPDAAPGG